MYRFSLYNSYQKAKILREGVKLCGNTALAGIQKTGRFENITASGTQKLPTTISFLLCVEHRGKESRAGDEAY